LTRRTRPSGITHTLFGAAVATTVVAARVFTQRLGAIRAVKAAVTDALSVFTNTILAARRLTSLLIDAIRTFITLIADAAFGSRIAFAVRRTAGFTDRTTRIRIGGYLLIRFVTARRAGKR